MTLARLQQAAREHLDEELTPADITAALRLLPNRCPILPGDGAQPGRLQQLRASIPVTLASLISDQDRARISACFQGPVELLSSEQLPSTIYRAVGNACGYRPPDRSAFIPSSAIAGLVWDLSTPGINLAAWRAATATSAHFNSARVVVEVDPGKLSAEGRDLLCKSAVAGAARGQMTLHPGYFYPGGARRMLLLPSLLSAEAFSFLIERLYQVAQVQYASVNAATDEGQSASFLPAGCSDDASDLLDEFAALRSTWEALSGDSAQLLSKGYDPNSMNLGGSLHLRYLAEILVAGGGINGAKIEPSRARWFCGQLQAFSAWTCDLDLSWHALGERLLSQVRRLGEDSERLA